MQTYLFWATVRVQHEGELLDERIMRGFRAETELEARRAVLDSLLKRGYNVRRLELEPMPDGIR